MKKKTIKRILMRSGIVLAVLLIAAAIGVQSCSARFSGLQTALKTEGRTVRDGVCQRLWIGYVSFPGMMKRPINRP